MSEVIDSSVVELSLDNSNFEQNVKKSIALLDQFKGAVGTASSYTQDAGERMASALGNIAKISIDKKMANDLGSVEQAAKLVVGQFTVWGQVVQDLRKKLSHLISNEITLIPRKLSQTASLVTGLIKSGGLSRALNLERAQFQMKGLGISWKAALDDINYAVKDTAYGLDSAARAASQLSASGVHLGDDMKAALRGISGVAAMTSSSYDEIAYIFTATAGMGRVMAEQLNRLNIRGINAYATLAKYLNKTQAEVRDMVSAGEIDFDTFAKAMDSAFGEHAKKANETFEGALSNTKAALSRIGAELATPYYDAARDVLNNLKELINSIKEEMDPLLDSMGRTITILGERISGFVGSIKIPDGVFDSLDNFVRRLNSYLKSDAFTTVGETVLSLFKSVAWVVDNVADLVGEIVGLVGPAFKQATKFSSDFAKTAGKAISNVFWGITSLAKKLAPIVEPIAWAFSDAFAIISKTVESVGKELTNIGFRIGGLANPIAEVIAPLAGPLYRTIVTIGKVISNIIIRLVDVFEALLPIVTPVIKVLSAGFKMWLFRIERIWNYVSLIVTAVTEKLAPVLTSAGRLISRIGDLLLKVVDGFESMFMGLWNVVFGPTEDLIGSIADKLVGIFDLGTKAIFFIEPKIKEIMKVVAYSLGFIAGSIVKIFTDIKTGADWVGRFVDWLKSGLGVILGIVGLIGTGLTWIFSASFLKLSKPLSVLFIGIGKVKDTLGGLVLWIKENIDFSKLFSSENLNKILNAILDDVFTFTLGVADALNDLVRKISSMDFVGVGKSILEALLSPFTGHSVGASTLYEVDDETAKMIASSGLDPSLLTKTDTATVEKALNQASNTFTEASSKAITKTGQEVQKQSYTTTEDVIGKIKSFVIDKIVPAVSSITGGLNEETIASIVETLQKLTPIIKTLLMTWGITHVFKPFKKAFEPFKGIFKPIGAIFKPLEEAAKQLKKANLTVKFTTGLEDTMKSLVKVGKSISKYYKANAFVSYGKGFLLIASSIGVLTGSLVALTKFVDPNKIYDLAPVMTIMVGGIALLAKTIGGLNFARTATQVSALDRLVPNIRSVLGSLKSTIETFKVNSFMTAFGASVGLLAVGIMRFAKVDWETGLKAAGFYAAFLAELVSARVLMKLAKADDWGKFSLSFSASVGLLGISIRSFTNVDWAGALNTMIIFGGFLAELVGYQALLKLFKIDKFKGFSIGFAAAIPLLSIGVRSFADIKFTDALPMLAVAGTFFTEMAAVSAIINSRKATFMNTIYTLLTMGEMFVIMEGLAVTISMMTLLDGDKLMSVATPLALVGAMFAAMEFGSAALAKTKITGLLLIIAGLTEIVYGLYYLTTTLTEDQVERLDIISNAVTKILGISALASALFAAAGSLGWKASLVGIGAFAGLGVVVAGLATVAGVIKENVPVLSELGEEGLPMLVDLYEQIGNMFGKLNSGLLSGLGEGVGGAIGGYKASKLESQFNGIGELLGETTATISDFAVAVNTNVSDDTISKASKLGGAIEDLVKAGDSRDKFVNLHFGLNLMKNDLPAFATAAEGLTDTQRKAVGNTATIIEKLGGAIEAIPKTSKLGDLFAGVHDVKQFGEDLGSLASGMMAYYKGITTDESGAAVTIDTKLVSNSATAAQALARLNALLPKSGGALQDFLGSQNLELFATNLGALGKGLHDYQDAWGTTTPNTSLIKNTATAAQAIARLNTMLPKSGGEFQNIFGTQDLGVFGTQLKDFGTYFMEFYNAVKGFTPTDAIAQIQGIGMSYAELASALPPEGGTLYKFIFGEKNLATFGQSLVDYAVSLQTYQAELEKVDFDKLTGGTAFLEGLEKLFTADIDTTTNFEQLQTIAYYVHQIIMSITEELEKEKNVAALQNAGVSLLDKMLSGMNSDAGKLLANAKLDDVFKVVADTVPYNQTLETENFGDKFLAKISSAIITALATTTRLATVAASIVAKLSSGFNSVSSTYRVIGKNVVDGLAKSMTSLTNQMAIFRAGVRLGNLAILGLKKGTDSHSPSKEAEKVGEYVVEGLDLGFTDGREAIYEGAVSLGETAVDGLTDGIESSMDSSNPFGLIDAALHSTSLSDEELELKRIYDNIDLGLIKTLRQIDTKYDRRHENLGNEFKTLSSEVSNAQLAFIAMQNDPNATKEDLDLAYRRLTILQGSIESLDRRGRLLDREKEEEEELARITADRAKEEARASMQASSNNERARSSADDAKDSVDDLADGLGDAADAYGDLGDAAGDAAENLDSYRDDFSRAGYNLANAFENEGWWRAYVDEGFGTGSILGGNILEGLTGKEGAFGEEGLNLGEILMEGFNEALFGSGPLGGIIGIINRLGEKTEEGTTVFQEAVQNGVSSLLNWLGVETNGAELSFTSLLERLKTNAGSLLEGLGIDFSNFSSGVINFFSSLGIDTSGWQQKWNGFVTNAVNFLTGGNAPTTQTNGGGGGIISRITSGVSNLISGLTANNSDVVVIDPDANKVNPSDIVIIEPSPQPIPTISGSNNRSFMTALRTGAAAKSATQSFKSYASTKTATAVSPTVNTDNRSVVGAINNLEYRVQTLQSEIRNTNMVLDSGALVGGIARGVRSSIANMTLLEGRGV